MFKILEKRDVSGYTLILPSISVGNVSQLAVDLLISTTKPLQWASIWHDALIPTVGGDPYQTNSTALMSSCELFLQEKCKLVIMQLRSPLIKRFRKKFLQDILEWIKNEKISKVVILASLSAHERLGMQLEGPSLRYLASPCIGNDHLEHFRKLKWVELEKRSVFPAPAQPYGHHNIVDGDFYMPGGGFAKQFHSMCSLENLPVVTILKFCDEGCNTPDAIQMADYLNAWLTIIPRDNSWKNPSSWCLLFGNPPPIEIF